MKITRNFVHSQVHGLPFPLILSTDLLGASVHGTLALLGSWSVCLTCEMNKLNPVTNTTEFKTSEYNPQDIFILPKHTMIISIHCFEALFCNAKKWKVLPDAQDGSSKLLISTGQK